MRCISLQGLLLYVCLALCGGRVLAAPILLHNDSSGLQLNAQIELLEDVGGKLTIADVAAPAMQARFSEAKGRASVGQNPNPWWIKLQLQRATDAPSQWWLEIGSVTQLNLQLYSPDGQGGWTMRQSGEQVSFAAGRDHDYRRMLLQLPALGSEPQTVYLRSFDPAGNSFPLRIWQLQDLDQLATQENLGLGLIYGIITALLLYNLFIYFSLRDKAYFWYVLTTAGALLMIVSMSGHGAQYLWPHGPVPFWLDRITLPSLWGFAACSFTQTLLQTRHYVRWAHRLLAFACVCYVIAIALDAFGQRSLAAWIIALLSLTSIPAALGAALIRWRQGYFPALLYLCGYGLVLSSISLALMRATGLVQPATWNAYVFPLSVAAESILFSFALAYRIQMLKHEKSVAILQADREKTARMAQMQSSAEELQEAVRQRTAELAEANRLLCEREKLLEFAAFHDPLTELPNRRYLVERAETSLADANRRGESVALLLIDLDHFKPVNDTYGHDAGDLLLRTIGHRLREHVRTNDMVARLGGDEFAVLVCGPDAQAHTREIAERLLDTLATPVLYGNHQLAVSISVGGAFYPQHAQQFSGLYKSADEALYRAKQKGRSGFVLQDGDGETSTQTSLMLDVLKVPSGLA